MFLEGEMSYSNQTNFSLPLVFTFSTLVKTFSTLVFTCFLIVSTITQCFRMIGRSDSFFYYTHVLNRHSNGVILHNENII